MLGLSLAFRISVEFRVNVRFWEPEDLCKAVKTTERLGNSSAIFFFCKIYTKSSIDILTHFSVVTVSYASLP